MSSFAPSLICVLNTFEIGQVFRRAMPFPHASEWHRKIDARQEYKRTLRPADIPCDIATTNPPCARC